jgi:hypothetical protein
MSLTAIQKRFVLVLAIPLVLFLFVLGSLYVYPTFFQNKAVESTLPTPKVTSEPSITPNTPSQTDQNNGTEASSPVIWATTLANCQKDPEADFNNEKGVSHPDRVFITGLLALAKKDVAICASTGSAKDDNGSTCEENYVLMTTLSTTGSDCGKIANKDLSLSCSANRKKDPSICSQIPDTTMKTICEAATSGDTGTCSTLPADQKSDCANTVTFVKSLNGHDANACDKIDIAVAGGRFDKAYCTIVLGPNPKKAWDDYYANTVCLQRYSNNVAKEKSDVSSCENIPGKGAENKKLYEDCVAQFK